MYHRTREDIRFLPFRSGYTSFGPSGCDHDSTVNDCVARANTGVLPPANFEKFLYGGGHLDKHASLAAAGMNRGALANVALAPEICRELGTEIGRIYTQPQLAGGIRSSAVNYALTLRKNLAGKLRIGALLGSNATCTNPATRPSALNSPI